jgi:cysteinyl-tRNA synthetase
MDDDFNTPRALAALFDLANAINQAADAGTSFCDAKETLLSLSRDIFGLIRHDIIVTPSTLELKLTTYAPTIIISDNKNAQPTPETLSRVGRLVEERLNSRKSKNWQRADQIRKGLAALGVALEDSQSGTSMTYERVPSEESLDKLFAELGIAP